MRDSFSISNCSLYAFKAYGAAAGRTARVEKIPFATSEMPKQISRHRISRSTLYCQANTTRQSAYPTWNDSAAMAWIQRGFTGAGLTCARMAGIKLGICFR